MKILKWKDWGIGARLIFITTLPIALMFCSIVWYSYHSRLLEVQEELAERGHVIATAIADSSEYGLTSGIFSDLDKVANSLVQADSSIYQISILDTDKHVAVRTITTGQRDADNRVFEVPIRKKLLSMDEFSEDGTPHISGSKEAISLTVSDQVIGYVRVIMSPSNMITKQKERFYVQLTLISCVLIASLFFAFYLARNLNRPMADSIAALRQIRGGNYAVHVNVTTGGEIGDLQSSINEMSISLNQAKQNLENKVLERTKDLEASRNDAVKADAEKRKLIQKMNSIVEDERKSIAIEIHDELNAMLIGAKLESQRILTLASVVAVSNEAEEIKVRAQSIVSLIKDLYARGRAMVTRLRPEVLDMLGLHGAIDEMVRHYDVIHPACRFEFHSNGDFSTLESGVAIAAYRLTQEALSNVVKHSQASKASVFLVLDHEKNLLQLVISDNGIGFDPETVSSGIGVIGMRERVYGFNGKIEIHSGKDGGTEITARFPLFQISA